MTNKPMLSVERELRGAVEQALLAIKRIYQAGHDGIVGAGGSCDQPGVMFECDPTVRGLRALLSRPEGWLPCSPELLESGVDCATAPRWSNKEWDGHSHWHPSPAAQHQGEPVALQHMAVAEDGKLRWMTGRKMQHCELYAMPDGSAIRSRLYAEHPAPVAPVAVAHTMRSVMEAYEAAQKNHLTGTSNFCAAMAARLNGVKPWPLDNPRRCDIVCV